MGMFSWFSKKKVPTDKEALIPLAAEHLPWQQTASGNLVVEIGDTRYLKDKYAAGLMEECTSQGMVKYAYSATLDTNVFMATDEDLKTAIRKAHGFKAPVVDHTDTQAPNPPSGQDLIDRGNQKEGRSPQ